MLAGCLGSAGAVHCHWLPRHTAGFQNWMTGGESKANLQCYGIHDVSQY
jgi:hypothetical protein